jgi:alpha-beta hydrolase superfamily lysophospholipase
MGSLTDKIFVVNMLHILLSAFLSISASQSAVTRQNFFVNSDPGIRLFVREVTAGQNGSGKPILLVHGARVPGVGSFDLPVSGGSLAEDLAQRGFDVYILDVRGYGQSTRPKEMHEPPTGHPPLVRSNEAVRDIAAAVDWIRSRRHGASVALFGWATGGQWAAHYASLYPEKVSALIVLNSLYGASSPHPLMGRGSDMEDPAHPGHFNRSACGAYRLNDAQSLLRQWDRSIPVEDKSLWRDPAIAKAYVDAALASDPTSNSRTPPSMRSPCGALEDSFYLAIGRRLFDASLITAPVLIVASERDFWSRPEDRQAMADELVHSPKARVVVIPSATHFVHLDRPERGRDTLIKEISEFAGAATASGIAARH